MRVIAGTLKGRRLTPPTWDGLRPTSDRLRETLFNVLGARVEGARVLDAYAGTGAVGIEALSRGAAHVTFVESERKAQVLIAGNLAACRIEAGYTVVRATAGRAFEAMAGDPAFAPFDIILLDPPYDQPPEGVLHGVDRLLASGGLLVLEHARRVSVPERHERLVLGRDLRSGDSALAFYTCQP